MTKPLYDKLSKKDLNRHFPNVSHGGKGSHRRKYDASSESNFRDGWDAIFGKKSPAKDTDYDDRSKEGKESL